MRTPRAVFLDKDGTLVVDIPYNVDPDRMRLAPGVPEGLQALQAAGYRLIVITNQSGVARGYFSEKALAGVEGRLQGLLAASGVALDGFYYCPHHPDGTVREYSVECECRKPAPGLVLRAAREHGIDRSHAWLIGDILNDVEAGKRAGVRTVLVDNGNETEWDLAPQRQPDYTAAGFFDAARWIIQADRDLPADLR